MIEKIVQQYETLKTKHPDALLMFRARDRYEMFLDDAAVGEKVLGLIIHKRNNIPFVSFPHCSLDTILPKLVRIGHRVAICDQID